MTRSDAMKKAQKKYYEANKKNINKKQKPARVRRFGDEETFLQSERERAKKYYAMNRNYRDIDILYTNFLWKIL